jgi:hypothetical protein
MARTRTRTDDLHAQAMEDLVAALTAAGLEIEGAGARSLTVRFDDVRFDIDVVPVAYGTAARAEDVVARLPDTRRVPVLVADRVTADARDRLADAGWGWLDRRGSLRVRGPAVLIDTNVPAAVRPGQAPDDPVRGRAGIAIAYRLLTHPSEPMSTTRSGLGFAPSTISDALKRLRSAGLVDGDGLPVIPELFWVLSERWTPERTWLTEEPDAKASDAAGWCVSGTVAAAELGAPIVSAGATPDLYVPGPVVVTIAARRYGVARDAGVAAASIAVAPAREVTDGARPPVLQSWPLAHPVAVALDLAQDRARGREILDDWSPPERAW